jgi:prepilin peptidase CpaA
MLIAAIFLIFPLCLAIAALSDLFTMTIPNRASVILVGGFIVVAPFLGLSLPEIGMYFGGAAIVFCVCFALFALNVMGGGDAKLLSAAALWFGFNQSLLEFVIYVSFMGGLITVFIVALRARVDVITAVGLRVPSSLLVAKKVPYGLAIGVGGFMAYPSSPLVEAALAHLH